MLIRKKAWRAPPAHLPPRTFRLSISAEADWARASYTPRPLAVAHHAPLPPRHLRHRLAQEQALSMTDAQSRARRGRLRRAPRAPCAPSSPPPPAPEQALSATDARCSCMPWPRPSRTTRPLRPVISATAWRTEQALSCEILEGLLVH